MALRFVVCSLCGIQWCAVVLFTFMCLHQRTYHRLTGAFLLTVALPDTVNFSRITGPQICALHALLCYAMHLHVAPAGDRIRKSPCLVGKFTLYDEIVILGESKDRQQ